MPTGDDPIRLIVADMSYKYFRESAENPVKSRHLNTTL